MSIFVPEASWTEGFQLLLGNRSKWSHAFYQNRIGFFWNSLQRQMAW